MITPPATNPSRDIPDAIKRIVRQRCGFGCVICGVPLYEFDHMETWAKEQEHDANNITLLCDQHHKEKTNKWLPLETVKLANKNPHNKTVLVSPWYKLHLNGETFSVQLGSNTFFASKGQLTVIRIDDLDLLSFKQVDGRFLMTMALFDDDDHFVATIIDNQLMFGTEQWDVKVEGTRLQFRRKLGDIFLDIEFAPPSKVIIRKAIFKHQGLKVVVVESAVGIPQCNTILSHSEFTDVSVGIGIGPDHLQRRASVPFPHPSRVAILDETAVSWTNRQIKAHAVPPVRPT